MKNIQKHLKTKYFLFLLIFNFTNVNAQNNWDTKEKTYSNGVLLSGYIDLETNEILYFKPTGKNVIITYDPFYNVYKMSWDELDGKSELYLKPKKETPENGTIFIDTYANDEVSQFFIINTLDKDKKIKLISAYPKEVNGRKYKLLLAFEGFN